MTSIATSLGISIPTIEIADIGAMQEGVERYADLLTLDLANVTGFEPNPVEIEKLRAASKHRCRYLQYFLGKGGRADFYITRYPGCCSLYEPDPHVINRFTGIGTEEVTGNFWVTRTEQVDTKRLDDVGELPPLDYLKLDIQGAELDVLQGGEKQLASATVIELEVEFVPLYKRQPLFGEIQTFLASRGYVLHKFLDIAGRCLRPFLSDGNVADAISQVLWADAIFVRNYFDLSNYADDQLLKTATILHHVYGSYDLVHVLLAEYDQRLGTQTSVAYATLCTQTPMFPKYMNLKLHV